jgi:hypothetical protein
MGLSGKKRTNVATALNKITDKESAMKTFTSEQKASDFMRMKNRARVNSDVSVLVDGPDDLEFTVMPLKEAVEMGFSYEWEV